MVRGCDQSSVVIDLSQMPVEMPVQVQQKVICGHWVTQHFFGKQLLEPRLIQASQDFFNHDRGLVNGLNDFGSRDILSVEFGVAVALKVCAPKINANKLVEVADQMQCQIARRVFDFKCKQPEAVLSGVSLEFDHQFCQVALIEFDQVLGHGHSLARLFLEPQNP
jgi:hypothetical protein